MVSVGEKFLLSLWQKLPLAQNNLQTTEAHLGVTHSGLPQHVKLTILNRLQHFLDCISVNTGSQRRVPLTRHPVDLEFALLLEGELFTRLLNKILVLLHQHLLKPSLGYSRNDILVCCTAVKNKWIFFSP